MIKELNIVTCGNCGELFGHKLECEELTCPYCKFESEVCDFPDLFYPPEHNDSLINIQPKPELTELEYSVLIQALKDAQASHFDDEFVDPYASSDVDYTHAEIKDALERVENKIMNIYLDDTEPSIVASRADIDDLGYDSSELDNADFARIARKAGEYCMENWWEAIDILCEDRGLTKNKK